MITRPFNLVGLNDCLQCGNGVSLWKVILYETKRCTKQHKSKQSVNTNIMRKIILASFALTFFAAATIVFQMASCKKSTAQTNCPPAVYPVTGLWEGTYQTD